MPTIRMITADDAAGFLVMARQLDEETPFMIMESGERRTTVAEQRERIESVLVSDNSALFVVEDGDRLVGCLGVDGGTYRRTDRTGHIWVGILQNYNGQGLGTRLFQRLEEWAVEASLHRLELTVMTHNAAGMALYRKMGFTIGGTKRHCLFVDGAWVDEYLMAKLLD